MRSSSAVAATTSGWDFWPASEIEPFATFINGVAKHVAASAPLEPQWTNAHVIDGDLVEFTRRLKDGPGGDIGVHGSMSVAQALLAGGIVDEPRPLSLRASRAADDGSSTGRRRCGWN